MRQFCQALGGDLINLSDITFYRDLMLYFRGLDLPNVHFWIGATDEEKEGFWVWTDGSPVTMGTPYWANFGDKHQQMPTGGTSKNCAMLDATFHYYFSSYYCSNSKDVHPICEQ
ncbi:hypothetical protein E2C01_092054 [Portunus trituberculatus]|uniref:C-type lectin domain-containing protein n=1 Tax=Portunus trituberculatus TaxID=210409 RepID=A0A5B7JR13_PORTR|nr:hypothetical protein [Portunus trituberculatus]